MPDKLNLGPFNEMLERPDTKRQLMRGQAFDEMQTRNEGDQTMVLPPRPYPFKPEPFVNNPLAQQLLHRMLNKAPAIGSSLRRVTVGPTDDIVDRLAPTQFNVNDFPQTNLGGTTNTLTNNVSLNPRLVQGPDRNLLLDTLAHELTHVAGHDDDVAYDVGHKTGAVNKSVIRDMLQR